MPGAADLMTRVAYPLPARVICELLGMPPEDHSFIAAHARDLAGGLDPVPSAAAVARADRAVGALRTHLLGVIAARRRMPADDLVSALVAACDGGDRLADDELVATLVLLLIAGHETTANLIGNAMVVLDAHPSQAAALGGGDDMADTAVDELLRFDPPVQIAQRVALAPVALGGRTVPTGAAVIVSLSAANRDPDTFADPDRLDLARSPNPHLSFGAGVHHCLGAALARAEGRIALRALTRERTRLRVARPYPRHRPSLTVRGYGHLPVELP